MRLLMPTLSLVMIGAAVALADPYGPPYAVTDMAPFCATCHASASPAQLQGLPADVAAGETIDGKHLSRIKTDPAYRDLSPADREQLIAAIKRVDEQASVTIKAPFQARRNSQIEVTVVTRGGAGPVVGDRKSTRLNSSHLVISYAVFCLKKKKKKKKRIWTQKMTVNTDGSESMF